MNNYKKVLVVEDEEAVRNEILEILSMENFQVSSAKNGLDGLIMAKKSKPDIIVSDILMPMLNGYQFIKRIKKNPETENIPVIFLSAKTTKNDINHGIYLGAVSYLTKPLSVDELLMSINNGLENTQKENKKRAVQEENDIPYSITVNNRKIPFKPFKTHEHIKKIALKEAKKANRVDDIEFLLQTGYINQDYAHFEKLIRNMIRYSMNNSSKGNSLFVLSKYRKNGFSITIKAKNKMDKTVHHQEYKDKRAYLSLGNTLELSMIKSISRLLNGELSVDVNKNNSFSISILLKQ